MGCQRAGLPSVAGAAAIEDAKNPRPEQQRPSPLELLTTRATVSVSETAAILSISRGQAYAMANDGTLRVLRIGSRLVIPTDQLREMIAGAA